MCGAEHTAGARGFRVHIVQEYGKHPSPRARRADATGPTRPDGESATGPARRGLADRGRGSHEAQRPRTARARRGRGAGPKFGTNS